MRSILLASTFTLSLTACGGGADPGADPRGNPASVDAAAARLNVCDLVPKATAALLLAGAANDPTPTAHTPGLDGCSWQGADVGIRLGVMVDRRGIAADVLRESCAGFSPPLPTIDGGGLGVGACGQFDGRYTNLVLQVDATTAILVSGTGGGTQAQALEVARAVVGRLPPL